jgi:hypothetical protein
MIMFGVILETAGLSAVLVKTKFLGKYRQNNVYCMMVLTKSESNRDLTNSKRLVLTESGSYKNHTHQDSK